MERDKAGSSGEEGNGEERSGKERSGARSVERVGVERDGVNRNEALRSGVGRVWWSGKATAACAAGGRRLLSIGCDAAACGAVAVPRVSRSCAARTAAPHIRHSPSSELLLPPIPSS